MGKGRQESVEQTQPEDNHEGDLLFPKKVAGQECQDENRHAVDDTTVGSKRPAHVLVKRIERQHLHAGNSNHESQDHLVIRKEDDGAKSDKRPDSARHATKIGRIGVGLVEREIDEP